MHGAEAVLMTYDAYHRYLLYLRRLRRAYEPITYGTPRPIGPHTTIYKYDLTADSAATFSHDLRTYKTQDLVRGFGTEGGGGRETESPNLYLKMCAHCVLWRVAFAACVRIYENVV